MLSNEKTAGDGATTINDATVNDFNVPQCPPHTTESKLMRRIDLHVIPFLCILYLLAFLDRVNIGNANVYGLAKDLKLKGHEYNVALVVFFVPYILFEIPSNVLLKHFKPRLWLSFNMFGFGVVTMCQGFVKNYAGLLVTRTLLGVFETGMFPGCFYLISMWYKRSEAQKRYTFFFGSTTLAGAFGGLIAAGIGHMDGTAGYKGWRWIFILEGLLTAVIAILFFFILPNFPEDTKWLTPEEKTYVAARLQVDQGKAALERKMTGRDVARLFKDWKIYPGAFMYMGTLVAAYGYAYFSPTLIKTYGYSPIHTQLFSVPPWAAAFVVAMTVAALSDKVKMRMPFALFCTTLALIGFCILVSVHDNIDLQYGALFLVTCGSYSSMPLLICWFTMNLGGHHRRSVGTAWMISVGNIGGIIAVFAFLQADAPKYIKGYSICLAFDVLALVTIVTYAIMCLSANRKRRRGGPSHLTEEEKTDLGDMNPDYRYLL
ncbi:MFS general substrate transporter [Piedraia hortae CBS 480.64]|uniref:MFS general substrate transporter n=1 Tax=Piedraia hortae CBS 480.64 TaxID=1314780 RepID=A0A6A7C915_9PEZI|nr:MFS general substrate transporter [Piedraia hortae CBS 480.64]